MGKNKNGLGITEVTENSAENLTEKKIKIRIGKKEKNKNNSRNEDQVEKSSKKHKVNIKILISKFKNLRKAGSTPVEVEAEGKHDQHKGVGIRGIRVKLIGAFMIPVALIVILGVLSYTRASQAIMNNYRTAIMSTVVQSGQYFNVVIQNVEQQATQLAGDASLINYYGGAYEGDPVAENNQYLAMQKSVMANIASQSDVDNIAVIAPYGKDIFMAEKVRSGTYALLNESDEGAKLAEEKKGYWSGYHTVLDQTLKQTGDEYALSFSKSVFNSSFKQVAVVIIDIKMETVMNALESIDLPEGSVAAFITGDGRQIITGGNDKIDFVNSSYYQDAVSGEDVNGAKTITIDGENYMYVYDKIGEHGFVVNILLPEDQIVKQAASIKNLTFGIVAFAIIVATLVGFIIATGFGNAIKKINQVVQKASEGDLTVVAKTKRKDEFRLLSRHVTGMLSGMKGLIQRAAEVSNDVAESSESVAIAAEQLVEASKSISEVIEQIESGIAQQADDAVVCINKMTDLEDKINHVNVGTSQIAQFAKDTKGIVKDGIVSISQLDEKAKATTEITHAVIESIEQLEAESHSIGSITGAMNEIAEQTSLLSLNASIEAARAGSAGRGFAVVADEIRKLADASLDASKKINKIIDGIQTKTKDTVKNAKQAEEIVSSQEAALKNTVQVFDKINGHVDGLNQYISEISSGVTDIETAKNQTMEAIESISAMLQETAASSAEVQAAADSQLSAAEQLNISAEKLGKESGELQSAISSFTI